MQLYDAWKSLAITLSETSEVSTTNHLSNYVKRVLLVGGSGMLGSNIVVSNSAFELYPTCLRNRITHPRASQLDISDRDSVLKQVEAIKPEAIVHAGGLYRNSGR